MWLLLSTIALRPYVFIFLASFLVIGTLNFGTRATLIFAILRRPRVRMELSS
jgi:hypothetical protein